MVKEMYLLLSCLLSSSLFSSQCLRWMCVVCGKWKIVWASGSVMERETHFLLLIYFLASLDHHWMTSAQPPFLQSSIWLSGWSSCLCAEAQLVSLADDKLCVAASLQEPFPSAHLWPSHWKVSSPLGSFFLHPFFMKTLCVSDHPLRKKMRQMNSSCASPLSACNIF
jgi:hypothetical protein